MGDAIENLRMIKSYRTPQTLRSFARIFTSLMPPFFAPAFAQLAINSGSLAMGVIFAIITGLCLNALLEGVEILEDPFVAFVTLDGVDVREELQVLHYQQLVNARNEVFPDAKPYEDPGEEVTVGMLTGDHETNHSAESTSCNKDKRVSFAETKNTSSRRMSVRNMSIKNLLAEEEEAIKVVAKKMFSHGDANFSAGNDFDSKRNRRQSSYQLQLKEEERD